MPIARYEGCVAYDPQFQSLYGYKPSLGAGIAFCVEHTHIPNGDETNLVDISFRRRSTRKFAHPKIPLKGTPSSNSPKY